MFCVISLPNVLAKLSRAILLVVLGIKETCPRPIRMCVVAKNSVLVAEAFNILLNVL